MGNPEINSRREYLPEILYAALRQKALEQLAKAEKYDPNTQENTKAHYRVVTSALERVFSLPSPPTTFPSLIEKLNKNEGLNKNLTFWGIGDTFCLRNNKHEIPKNRYIIVGITILPGEKDINAIGREQNNKLWWGTRGWHYPLIPENGLFLPAIYILQKSKD